jgi:Integral peroxisomal membrane peroxin
MQVEDAGVAETDVDRRSSSYVQRPAFSLPLMTNNFRRFNARIGIVFVFQNQLIRLFKWTAPTHTLSFLAIYSFVCLDPYLLVILPVAVVLLFIMVPAFLTRHPPPPRSASTSSTMPYHSINGPALAPPRTIKPASETSKDFFRNMRDLQNSMADFATLHDALVAAVAPPTNFSNEVFSSALFLCLWGLTALLFIAAHLFPWRFVFLVGGIAVICSGHPTAQSWLQKMQATTMKQAEALDVASEETSKFSNLDTKFFGVSVPTSPAAVKSSLATLSAITLDTSPQIREVEIFELQHRSTSFESSEEWKPHLFTPTPYDPLSPVRISGDRPRGTRFFEDVQQPSGWVWEGKKWELDLEAREWVSERLITGVEFDAALEGERVGIEFGGWVWDLPGRESPTEEEETWLAYDDDAGEPRRKSGRADQSKQANNAPGNAWQESTIWAGRTGQWRRRRWVRLVRRIGVDPDNLNSGRKPVTNTPSRKR